MLHGYVEVLRNCNKDWVGGIAKSKSDGNSNRYSFKKSRIVGIDLVALNIWICLTERRRLGGHR